MRTLKYAFLFLAVIAIPAAAGTKIAGKQTCAKSDPDYSIDLPDQAGHALSLHKSSCSYEAPIEIAGIQAKNAVDVATTEFNGMKFSEHGYNTSTMQNGDTFTVRYWGHGSAAKMAARPSAENGRSSAAPAS
jgi:hypothetical protein